MATPPPEFRYWAFISYSHADERHARWLHRALESFRGHQRLVGSVGQAGEAVPERVYPVFRDRDELAGAADLGERIHDALARSRTLIVVCSPRAAASRYVEQEIRHFKSLGREQRVLALIVDGEPHDAGRECFPAALKWRQGADGQPSGEPAEPLAADLRPGKDEPRDALLKIVAGVIGVGFDDLRQRDLQRRMRLRTIWAGVGGVLALAFLALAWVANDARIEADRQGRLALARQLAAQSELARAEPARIRESLELALRATEILAEQNARSFEVDAALRRSLALTPLPATPLPTPAGSEVVALVAAGAGELAMLASVGDAADRALLLQRWSVHDARAVGESTRWAGELVPPLIGERFAVVQTPAGRRLIDLARAKVVAPLGEDDEVLAVSDDATLLAFATPQAVRVVEAGSGRQRRQFQHPRDAALGEQRWNTVSAKAAAFSADSSRLAVGYQYSLYHKRLYGGVSVWHLGAEGKVDDHWISDHPVDALRYVDGDTLHWGHGNVWHVSRQGADLRLPGPDQDGRVAVGANGELVATASGSGLVRLWDAHDGSERWRAALDGPLRSLALVPDAGRLAVVDRAGRVTLHALDSGMAVPEPPTAPEPTSPAPKGVVLAADADTRRLLTRVAEPARGRPAAAAPETRYDSIVQLFGTGQPLAPPIRVNGVVDHARFSADGRRVAAGVRSGGERLVVWDAGAASVLAEWALGDARLDAVRITRAGERVIYRLGDGSVWAWAWPAAPRRFAAGEAFAVDEVGQRIAVAAGGQVRFFGLDTLAERPPVLATAAEALAFSPDGRWLAAGAGSDGPVWVWQIDPPLRVGLVENLASGGELAFSRGGAALGRTNRGEHVATPWALQALIDAARQRLAQRQLQ